MGPTTKVPTGQRRRRVFLSCTLGEEGAKRLPAGLKPKPSGSNSREKGGGGKNIYSLTRKRVYGGFKPIGPLRERGKKKRKEKLLL